ncbi:ribonuclease T2 family protein [Polycladidibacter hongkongensis]|uniref:ribonuclease T2 family protein n=1 Tax=Polycladidibacter hongkongensis TaxID=1647556 RepID=UPI00082AE41E|nr:hypothetical protein [Pseudovibrio hongkongensis]
MRFFFGAGVVIGLALTTFTAQATERLSGYFAAEKNCRAVVSIKKGSNPGEMQVEAGRYYELIGKNKKDATHYLVRIKEAAPTDRWVTVDCGMHLVKVEAAADADQTSGNGNSAEPHPAPNGNAVQYVLAASWQPAFCETVEGKPECDALDAMAFAAENFALHGLWPQPRGNVYCGVPNDVQQSDKDREWDELPKLQLSDALRVDLSEKMPGMESFLHRHEWIKHGTCYGSTAEEYYADSLDVLAQLNSSLVKDLFVERLGGFVSASDIRGAFDQSFGDGAGERVEVVCRTDDGRQIITELRIVLGGEIKSGTALAKLLANGVKTKTGCTGGIIDPVGAQ